MFIIITLLEYDADYSVGNNCQRGGFICEGYATKVPWPKNGTPRPAAPLVAKDRFPPDPTQQLYHRQVSGVLCSCR